MEDICKSRREPGGAADPWLEQAAVFFPMEWSLVEIIGGYFERIFLEETLSLGGYLRGKREAGGAPDPWLEQAAPFFPMGTKVSRCDTLRPPLSSSYDTQKQYIFTWL